MDADISTIASILQSVSNMSDQFINKNKSVMTFNSNVSYHLKYHLSSKLDIPVRENIENT
ncbi:hypothetical protein Syun_010059 [Stephania yunnanensis]|uniref:Uncharacterized protein n=1 Tax=Stephania yunnanensis TaxID=152371 RepID=A0AAP0PRG4_9MAGN